MHARKRKYGNPWVYQTKNVAWNSKTYCSMSASIFRINTLQLFILNHPFAIIHVIRYFKITFLSYVSIYPSTYARSGRCDRFCSKLIGVFPFIRACCLFSWTHATCLWIDRIRWTDQWIRTFSTCSTLVSNASKTSANSGIRESIGQKNVAWNSSRTARWVHPSFG